MPPPVKVLKVDSDFASLTRAASAWYIGRTILMMPSYRVGTGLSGMLLKTTMLLTALAAVACKHVAPFSVAHVDQTVNGPSAFPVAVDPTRVGSFPGSTKSGAGFFYDQVLEYRVWLHPERGARQLA